MSIYTLENGEYVSRLKCECCGEQKKRVWGFVCKDGDAHAIYYALLNVEEEYPRVGLTVSVGPWWDGTERTQRSWVHLNVWPQEEEIKMSIRDPQESNLYPWADGGTPLDREVAKQNSVMNDIWPVADFIVRTDLAVSSYLNGEPVNTEGREERDADTTNCTC